MVCKYCLSLVQVVLPVKMRFIEYACDTTDPPQDSQARPDFENLDRWVQPYLNYSREVQSEVKVAIYVDGLVSLYHGRHSLYCVLQSFSSESTVY